MISTIISIILTLLKIVGIVLLALLGIILFVILSVLFNPIRYSVSGSFDSRQGTYEAKGRITYLYHIITVLFDADNNSNDFKIKLLWFELKEKPDKKIKRKNKSQAGKGEAYDKEFFDDDSQKFISDVVFGDDESINDNNGKSDTKNNSEKEDSESLFEDFFQAVDSLNNNDTDENNEEKGAQDKEKASKEKRYKFIRKKIADIKNKREKLSGTYNKMMDKIKKVSDTKESYKDFLSTEESRQAISELKMRGFRILKHIKPKKFKLMLEYNLSDPSWTGKLYAFLSVFFNGINDRLDIRPDFDNEAGVYANTKFDVKGKLKLYIFLWHGYKLYRNKRIKEFYTFIKE